MADEAAVIESPPEAGGMAKFMADVTTDIAEVLPEAKPQEAPKPEVKPPESKPEPKPPEKPVEKPPVKAPETKPKPEDNNTLRKRLEEVSKSEKSAKTELEKHQAKIRELEAKRFYSEDDDKKVQALEKRSKELEQQLSESAYEKSDDFKSKYVEPWNRTIQGTLKMVTDLTITKEDGSTRKATEGDFWKVASLPVGEQADAAQQLFGTNALRILSQIDKLQDLKSQSDLAISTHRTGIEAKTKEQQESRSREQKLYDDTKSVAIQQLKDEYPQLFGDDPNDPEVTEKMQAGYDYVDKAIESMDKMPIADRAAYTAVLRARAAAFVRRDFEANRYKQKWEAAEAELKKLRGSDPGAGGEGAGQPPTKGDEMPTGGVEALTDEKLWRS